jgi:hypothetical protein
MAQTLVSFKTSLTNSELLNATVRNIMHISRGITLQSEEVKVKRQCRRDLNYLIVGESALITLLAIVLQQRTLLKLYRTISKTTQR